MRVQLRQPHGRSLAAQQHRERAATIAATAATEHVEGGREVRGARAGERAPPLPQRHRAVLVAYVGQRVGERVEVVPEPVREAVGGLHLLQEALLVVGEHRVEVHEAPSGVLDGVRHIGRSRVRVPPVHPRRPATGEQPGEPAHGRTRANES